MVTMVAATPRRTYGSRDADASEPTARLLASALRSLVARDDEPPSVWRSAAFADGVEAIRTSLAGAHTPSAIDRAASVLLDVGSRPGWPFPLIAQRLARDPAAVAIAIRWLEVDGRVALPRWPDVVRRHTLEPVTRVSIADVELWFG